jgi:hypothetical protein
MGWCWKSHPAFGYRDEMKSRLKLMMGKAHEDTSYALFPKNGRYIRKSDGEKLSTSGIALRITKRPGVSEQLFREELAQRWSNLSTKNGGSLASKLCIPFGKESTLGYSEMTHIIEQQNLYLQTTKQRIVRNLNDIDDEINFKTHDDVNMEVSGTTIREMFMKHLDNKGNALFHSMEHTNNSDVYRLLFDETNTEQVGTLLGTIDESLDAMGDWDNADSHYRFHSHKKVNMVGIQPRREQSDFWKKHFAGFVKNPIPSVIDTSHLHQPPKGRQDSNGVQSSYSDIARGNVHNENDSDVAGPTAAETATQHTKQKPAPSPGPQVIPTQQTGPASLSSLSSEGAMSGLSDVKRKLAEIDKEREKIIFSQHKIKDDVSEMTDSFTKMSGDMINLRKDLSDLSESVGRQMKELKEMMSSLINSRTIPSRGSPKRKKGKSSGTEHGSSSNETGSRNQIHFSKSWDSMCESQAAPSCFLKGNSSRL